MILEFGAHFIFRILLDDSLLYDNELSLYKARPCRQFAMAQSNKRLVTGTMF